MGYRELLQALEEEVGRQIRERRAEASQERAQTPGGDPQWSSSARRERVLEEERRRSPRNRRGPSRGPASSRSARSSGR